MVDKDKNTTGISRIESRDRRIFLKKAVYTAPVLMVLGTLPNHAYGMHGSPHGGGGMGGGGMMGGGMMP